MTVDENNYHEETKLDTNPCQTQARTLTVSTSGRRYDYFTSSRFVINILVLCISIHHTTVTDCQNHI